MKIALVFNIFINVVYYLVYHGIIVYSINYGEISWTPLYWMYLRRHFYTTLAILTVYGIFMATAKRSKKLWLSLLVCVTIILTCGGFYNFKRKFDMKKACHRLQTDTFDNFYDGYTASNLNFKPEYMPSSFQRGAEYSNVKGVKCVLNSIDQTYCPHYYTNEREHWSVYKH